MLQVVDDTSTLSVWYYVGNVEITLYNPDVFSIYISLFNPHVFCIAKELSLKI